MTPQAMSPPHDLGDGIPWAHMPYLDRRRINGTLAPARNVTLLTLIGAPRGSYNGECQDLTNPEIAALMTTADLGPFRAIGLKPALETFAAVIGELSENHPDVVDRLGLDRVLCARMVRGSDCVISSHAWGIAIDLTYEGARDHDPDTVPRGLLDLHRIFHRHGFFWGAAFARPEVMHFEASDQLVRRWARDGRLGGQPPRHFQRALMLSDRGPAIEAVQADLNRHLPFSIAEDGLFGVETRAAVFEFQRRCGIVADGCVGTATLRALAINGLSS